MSVPPSMVVSQEVDCDRITDEVDERGQGPSPTRYDWSAGCPAIRGGELPSGDGLVTFRTRCRGSGTGRGGSEGRLGAVRGVGPRLRRSVLTWRAGDVVEVTGAVRRRFFQAGGATVRGWRWRCRRPGSFVAHRPHEHAEAGLRLERRGLLRQQPARSTRARTWSKSGLGRSTAGDVCRPRRQGVGDVVVVARYARGARRGRQHASRAARRPGPAGRGRVGGRCAQAGRRSATRWSGPARPSARWRSCSETSAPAAEPLDRSSSVGPGRVRWIAPRKSGVSAWSTSIARPRVPGACPGAPPAAAGRPRSGGGRRRAGSGRRQVAVDCQAVPASRIAQIRCRWPGAVEVAPVRLGVRRPAR